MVSHDRYESIKNIFKRDPDTHKVVYGNFSLSEFEYLQDCSWNWTEKIDGMNIRIIVDEYTGIDFRGRSNAARVPKNLLKHLGDTVDPKYIRTELSPYRDGLCLYGEGAGPGIQAGSKYGPEQFFIMFDARASFGWTSRRDMLSIAKHLNVLTVPLIFEGTVEEAIDVVANGHKSTFGDFYAEGLVGRPAVELQGQYGNRIIAKIKHRDFFKRGKT